MSLRYKLILASGVLLILVTSVFLLNQPNKLNNISLKSKTSPISIFSTVDLGDRIIEVQMSASESNRTEMSSEISSKISMPFSFEGTLYYKWKLGEGVNLEEGSLSGELKGISKFESTLVKIKVTGFSKHINHQIGFEIYANKNGRKIFGNSIIASDQENTFENIVQNVEQIKN